MNAAEGFDLAIHAAELTAQIWATVAAAHNDVMKPEDALAHIGTLHQALLDARNAEDKAVHDKFDVITKPEIKAP